MKGIRRIKLFLALGFLAVAFSFYTEIRFLGIPAEVLLLIFSVLAIFILIVDSKMRSKR